MNSTGLMKGLYEVLKVSGALDSVNEFFRSHPEYFSKCHNGFTASINLNMVYLSDTLNVSKARPIIAVGTTDDYGINRELTVYPDDSIKQRTWSVRPGEVCIISEVME